MANPILKKSYYAGGVIGPNLAVKFSSSGTVVKATAATDSIIGITVPQLTPGGGDRVDVIHLGIADALAGGTVTRGDQVTSDANGKMVRTSPGTGTVGRIVGIALENAVAGDIFPVLLTETGVGTIIKTKRVQHVVTAGDVTGAAPILLDAVWDTPFADMNYTCDTNVEAISPAIPEDYYVNAFVRANDKITASISGLWVEGDVLILHALAIHD